MGFQKHIRLHIGQTIKSPIKLAIDYLKNKFTVSF